MRLLCVHAHFDDFEFVASGTFEHFRVSHPQFDAAKVVICTDGAVGHHEMGLEETRQRRWEEQQASAAIGCFEVERLRLPDGSIRGEANPVIDRPFLAALWKVIRDFEPDYLFCPPLPADSLAGVHLDHLAVAEAVRQVAYMINVPHAFVDYFPDSLGTAIPVKVPVILSTYDAYMAGSNPFDFVVDIEPVFEKVCQMAWCHESQIKEWLPWVGRHSMPVPHGADDWRRVMRDRYQRQSRDLGLSLETPVEAFMVTAWGATPTIESLVQDFPGLIKDVSPMENLRRRLQAG